MTAPRDPDRLIHGFLLEGEEYLHDQVYDEVRAAIEHKRQRAFVGPWRTPIMNKLVTYGLGAAAVVAVLVIGSQLLGPATPGGVGGAPSPTPVGGTVQFQERRSPRHHRRRRRRRWRERVRHGRHDDGAQAPTPSEWSVRPGMAIPGPSAVRPSRPRSWASAPAIGRRSSSGTARPNRSVSGSAIVKSEAEATAMIAGCIHRPVAPHRCRELRARGVRGAGAPA